MELAFPEGRSWVDRSAILTVARCGAGCLIGWIWDTNRSRRAYRESSIAVWSRRRVGRRSEGRRWSPATGIVSPPPVARHKTQQQQQQQQQQQKLGQPMGKMKKEKKTKGKQNKFDGDLGAASPHVSLVSNTKTPHLRQLFVPFIYLFFHPLGLLLLPFTLAPLVLTPTGYWWGADLGLHVAAAWVYWVFFYWVSPESGRYLCFNGVFLVAQPRRLGKRCLLSALIVSDWILLPFLKLT